MVNARRCILSVCLMLTTSSAVAAERLQIGRVVIVQGQVLSQNPVVNPTPAAVKRGQSIYEGDIIRTDKNSFARLLMEDKSLLDVGPSTYVNLAQYGVAKNERKRSVGIKLILGRLWARVSEAFGDKSKFEITTANAVAGVRGTELIVDYGKDGQSVVTVVHGLVAVSSSSGAAIELTANQRSSVAGNGGLTSSKVTQEEITTMASDSQPRFRLDINNQLITPSNAMPDPFEEDTGEQTRDRLNPATNNPAQRLLNLDPAVEAVRVRGRIKIQE